MVYMFLKLLAKYYTLGFYFGGEVKNVIDQIIHFTNVSKYQFFPNLCGVLIDIVQLWTAVHSRKRFVVGFVHTYIDFLTFVFVDTTAT